MLYQIKYRYDQTVLFEHECDFLKECVEVAVGVGADLVDVTISKPNGEKITLKNTPLQILGLKWIVIIFDKDMRIGCEFHSIQDWWLFNDDRISKMDEHALTFWRANKAMLQAICKANGRE
jgi:hypothetical protein